MSQVTPPYALGQIMWVPESHVIASKVVGMCEFNGRLFVATESGIFVKGEDDMFRPMAFVWETPPCPR